MLYRTDPVFHARSKTASKAEAEAAADAAAAVDQRDGLEGVRAAYDALHAASAALPPGERPIAYLAEECACVKREGGFVFRFDRRRFQKRGHQNGGGMRGGELPATEVRPPLDRGAFNFLRVAPAECLGVVALLAQGGESTYRLVVNKWPIYRRHVLLVSDELRPQVLRRADLGAAAAFMRRPLKNRLPCLFFNSWSAGASVNHFHFQAADQRLPIMDCEVVAVAAAVAAAAAGGQHPSSAAAASSALQLRGFPAHHAVVRLLPGAVGAAAAPEEGRGEGGGEDLGAAFTDTAVEQLWRLVSAMQASNQPHNAFFFGGLAVLVPRSRDPRRRGRFHRGCGGVDFGCNEFGGWFTAFTEDAFEQYDAGAAAAAMQECSEAIVVADARL